MPECRMVDSSARRGMRLRCAGADDIAAMTAIFERAFAEDAHTQLKVAWRGAAAMRDGMAHALEAWRVSPVATLLVVEDDRTGVMGWACWSTAGPEAYRSADGDDAPADRSPVEVLEHVTNQDIQRCRDEVISMYGAVDVLVAFVVDPAVQGQGVGGMLIDWGVRRADASGRACWVHASEAGARVLARHGFIPHHELVIDLAPYAPDPDSGTWGITRFCSMTRSLWNPDRRP